MSPFIHVVDGLLGLAAVSSFAGFVFHLLTGNPDLALMCFVGIGGSAAMVWMFSVLRPVEPSALPCARSTTALGGATPSRLPDFGEAPINQLRVATGSLP
jgi:hypothetical protein